MRDTKKELEFWIRSRVDTLIEFKGINEEVKSVFRHIIKCPECAERYEERVGDARGFVHYVDQHGLNKQEWVCSRENVQVEQKILDTLPLKVVTLTTHGGAPTEIEVTVTDQRSRKTEERFSIPRFGREGLNVNMVDPSSVHSFLQEKIGDQYPVMTGYQRTGTAKTINVLGFSRPLNVVEIFTVIKNYSEYFPKWEGKGAEELKLRADGSVLFVPAAAYGRWIGKGGWLIKSLHPLKIKRV